MMTPSVHLNGTPRDRLLEQLETAGSALRRAIGCLHDAAPNARDYYTQGDHAYTAAAREHNARIARVHDVLAEIQAIYEHTADAP